MKSLPLMKSRAAGTPRRRSSVKARCASVESSMPAARIAIETPATPVSTLSR